MFLINYCQKRPVPIVLYGFHKYTRTHTGQLPPETCRLCHSYGHFPSSRRQSRCTEMEFWDINLTKDSSLLLHAIHRPFLIILFFVLKQTLQKICETTKLESEKTQVYAKKPRLQMPLKNSISELRVPRKFKFATGSKRE
jgi:hypothetical protein